MRHIQKFFALVILLAITGVSAVALADMTLEASLSHLSFPVNQAALLTVTVNGASRNAAIELPEVPGITFKNRGQSSRVNIINGNVSSSLSQNYLIEAQKPGIYTIPPIKVSAGTEIASSKAMSFEVTQAGAQSGGQGTTDKQAEEVAFIRISEVADHYPGEMVPIKIKAYFNQKYRADINSLPTLHGDGVVMAQLKEKAIQTQEVLNGQNYNVLSWETTLSGIKEGKHPLSFSLEASLLLPQKRRSLSPFGASPFDDTLFDDPFFDSVLGGHQRKPITSVSPQTIFQVIPLPTANRPKDFTGAIGDFTMKVTVNRQETEVGEPLTLSVAISGRGNFDRIEAPLFPESPDWKTYAPSAAFTSQGNSFTGSKVFTQAIVAKNDHVTEIPALSFSSFNPRQKQYVTQTSIPLAIRLQKSGAPPAPPSSTVTPPKTTEPETKNTAPSAGRNSSLGLAPLHVNLDRFHPAIVPIFKQGWYILIVCFCLVLLVALAVYRIRRGKLTRHPKIAAQRQRRQQLAADLAKVEQAFAADDGPAFLTACKTTMQNQLGLVWQMAPTAICQADITARLGPESPLVAIFKTADEAAYGGAALSCEKMQDFLGKMRKELEELR